jgi:hypothetical protein
MDEMQEPLFTTVKLEDFVPADHPLRPLRLTINQALPCGTTVIIRALRVRLLASKARPSRGNAPAGALASAPATTIRQQLNNHAHTKSI